MENYRDLDGNFDSSGPGTTGRSLLSGGCYFLRKQTDFLFVLLKSSDCLFFTGLSENSCKSSDRRTAAESFVPESAVFLN
ncbi:hypothetical protein SDJN02_09842, partial [Cucurbita argyrosperma subsp. argyrosperma]